MNRPEYTNWSENVVSLHELVSLLSFISHTYPVICCPESIAGRRVRFLQSANSRVDVSFSTALPKKTKKRFGQEEGLCIQSKRYYGRYYFWLR